VGKKPYNLVIASHKGGTGRTTCALALANLWGRAGLEIGFVDAELCGARHVLRAGAVECLAPGVRFFPRLPEPAALAGCEVVVIDAPPLTEPIAQRVLRQGDGVLLTCLPDRLWLRTFPAAVAAIERAIRHNSRLEVLGLVAGIYHEQDELQAEILQLLRQTHDDMLLEPPIPYQREIAHWVLQPGNPLPAGPARQAYEALAGELDMILAAVAAA
jgi:cellulose biosynthesis protein BcsQ